MRVHHVMHEIRDERIRQGLSLEALGEKSGYTGNHIYSLEHGKNRAKIDIVSDLLQALGGKLKVEWDDERRTTEL